MGCKPAVILLSAHKTYTNFKEVGRGEVDAAAG